MIWVEVSSLSILGKDIPHSSKAINCSRLHSKDPRSRRLYQKKIRQQYKRQHLFKSYKKLSQWRKQYRKGDIDNHNQFLSKFESKFNYFHASTWKLRSKTARFGAKIKAGKCHWSPKYLELTDRIKLWRSVISWKKGCSTSRKKLKKLAENTYTDWCEIQAATDVTATEKHHAAQKHYNQEKPKFPEWRQAFHNDTDPYKGLFTNIKEAFDALVDSLRVLIDRYTYQVITA